MLGRLSQVPISRVFLSIKQFLEFAGQKESELFLQRQSAWQKGKSRPWYLKLTQKNVKRWVGYSKIKRDSYFHHVSKDQVMPLDPRTFGSQRLIKKFFDVTRTGESGMSLVLLLKPIQSTMDVFLKKANSDLTKTIDSTKNCKSLLPINNDLKFHFPKQRVL